MAGKYARHIPLKASASTSDAQMPCRSDREVTVRFVCGVWASPSTTNQGEAMEAPIATTELRLRENGIMLHFAPTATLARGLSVITG